ncbi:hypothetical protein GQ53DRAFT_743609 [Thozetella sp. PMI_491]|nr:hypothetical protein GQ53DRAFT_743609 [Thozetella sp. PMI_491]
MSSRRGAARGPNRNSGNGQGEEGPLWSSIQEEIQNVLRLINESTEACRSIVAQDNYMTKNKDLVDPAAEEGKMDDMLRKGVKASDSVKPVIESLIEQLTILRALQKAKEDEGSASVPSNLGPRERSGGLLSGSARSSSARGAREKEQRDREREREREQRERDREKEQRERDREREREREREKEREKERERERDRQSQRETDPSVYDFDGTGDSPVPSPIGRKLDGSSVGPRSDRSGNRDSVPPRGDRDTPQKGDSVPPESAGATVRAKVAFSKGQDVVFKPKPTTNNETPDWVLGRVQQVLGEGKSRRYKVQDADPDLPPDQRVEYRTSASSMIPIPPIEVELPEYEKGKIVLALYPDSTTFYKAEVMGSEASTGKVSLRFEGEENSVTLQLVERRYVVEFRN